MRAVVWRGNGPLFSSGRDLTEMTGHPGSTDLEWIERNQWQTRVLDAFPVPIICALKGWTLGVQLELALLCDVRLAGESAKLAPSAVDHGVIPDSAGVAKLVEIGGAALALDLALAGRRLGVAEALSLGLCRGSCPTTSSTTWCSSSRRTSPTARPS